VKDFYESTGLTNKQANSKDWILFRYLAISLFTCVDS